MHFTIEFVLDVTADLDALLYAHSIVSVQNDLNSRVIVNVQINQKQIGLERQCLLDQLMYMLFKFHLKKRGTFRVSQLLI